SLHAFLARIGTMNLCGKIVARASRPRCRAHGRDARATTCRFMGSLHAFFVAHWDQEPEIRKLFGIKPSVFRFMESQHANSGVHWDHEPRAWSADLQVGAFGARHAAPSWSSALRFMERRLGFVTTHCGDEPERRGAPASGAAPCC